MKGLFMFLGIVASFVAGASSQIDRQREAFFTMSIIFFIAYVTDLIRDDIKKLKP